VASWTAEIVFARSTSDSRSALRQALNTRLAVAVKRTMARQPMRRGRVEPSIGDCEGSLHGFFASFAALRIARHSFFVSMTSRIVFKALRARSRTAGSGSSSR
jgi:hypothetical protein